MGSLAMTMDIFVCAILCHCEGLPEAINRFWTLDTVTCHEAKASRNDR